MSILRPFDAEARTRMVFGPGVCARLGELALELLGGGARAFLVTDQGVRGAGLLAGAQASLEAAGIEFRIYDAVRANPTEADAAACAEAARDFKPGLFIGLGGGSCIDCARAANILLHAGGRMRDYQGYGLVSARSKIRLAPLIAIPTTAGTGSEMQSFALICRDGGHEKMACGDPQAAAKIALLDPELSLTMPRAVTAETGLDAIVHAVETAVTTKRNALSLMHSHRAFELLIGQLGAVLGPHPELEARGAMLLGASHAGLAIEGSMLGAAHAAANPLTSAQGLVHGRAVAIMLPPVVRYNLACEDAAAGYQALAKSAGLAGTKALLAKLEEALALAEVAPRLRDHGIDEAALDALAEAAAQQWTGRFNPRPVGPKDFRELYQAAF